jgi:hypothetical protein
MKMKKHGQQTHTYIEAVKTNPGNLATSRMCTTNHKSRKVCSGHLSQMTQVVLQPNIHNKPPKSPRASASMDSKVRVIFS